MEDTLTLTVMVIAACAAITMVLAIMLMLITAVTGIVRPRDPAPVRWAGLFALVVFIDAGLLWMFGDLIGDTDPPSVMIGGAFFGLASLMLYRIAAHRERLLAAAEDPDAQHDDEDLDEGRR